MTLETTASYVANLSETNPAGGDAFATGDNHLRLIKAALKRTFPNFDAAITANYVTLNNMATYAARTDQESTLGSVLYYAAVPKNDDFVDQGIGLGKGAPLGWAFQVGVHADESGTVTTPLPTGWSATWYPPSAFSPGGVLQLFHTLNASPWQGASRMTVAACPDSPAVTVRFLVSPYEMSSIYVAPAPVVGSATVYSGLTLIIGKFTS